MGHAPLKFWKAWKSPDLENRRPDDFDRDKRTLIVTGKVRARADAMPFLEEDMSRPKSNTLYLKLQASQEGDLLEAGVVSEGNSIRRLRKCPPADRRE